MKTIALLLLCISSTHLSFGGSVYLKNVMKPIQNADVIVTMMRWGKEGADTDTIIGQIASDKYRSVTLIFESTISTQTIRRLTIQSAVHACGDQSNSNDGFSRRSGGTPNGRVYYCADCMKSNAKSAMIAHGCIFKFSFPHDAANRKMRLVDVTAEGNSVTYSCKFNISPDLCVTTSKVPMPFHVTIHDVKYSFEDEARVIEEKYVAKVDEKKAPPVPSAVSVVCSKCGGSEKCADCVGKGKMSSDCTDCRGTGHVLSTTNVDSQFNTALTQTMEILSKMLRDESTLSVRRQLPIE